MSKFSIEDRLGALPSSWDPRHYRVPRATLLQVTQLPDEMFGLLPYTQTIIDKFTYPNQGNIGSCFPPHAKVLMEDFSYKEITNVEVGEYVITHTGSAKRISQKMKRKWQGTMVLLGVYGLPEPIESTPEHPYLTDRGWIEAKDLTINDKVLIPRVEKIVSDKTIYSIEKDSEFLWLLGLYLAEGHIYTKGYSNRITFSLHEDEVHFINRIRAFMKDYGISIHVESMPNSKGIAVRFSSKRFAKIFAELGSKLCDKKHLAKRLMFIDPKLQLEILRGWYDGDGHFRRNSHIGVTTSKKLVWQMYHLLLRSGFRGNIKKLYSQEGRKDAWGLEINWGVDGIPWKKQCKGLNHLYYGYLDGDFYYAGIKNIGKKRVYMGENVYNLEVEDDHSYVIDSVAVHNCVGWDGGIVMEITNLLEDKVSVDLSPGWCYWRSRIHANIPDHIEGSTNLGLVKALNADGATTELCAKTDTSRPFTISYCGEAFNIAKLYAIDEYWNINPNPNDIKAAMMGWSHEANYKMPNGDPGLIPLISAYPVYDSFYEANDNGGIVPLPKLGDRQLGGHSSALVGWKIIDGKTYYINMNSWGDEVGDNGFFYLPEDYSFYGRDFWLIHNGPPTDIPDPTPSPCNVGQGWANINNLLPQVLGRKGRFYYLNPR